MNYLEELSNWESTFCCDFCGNNNHNNFTYDMTMADGEIWYCNKCAEQIIVDEIPQEGY